MLRRKWARLKSGLYVPPFLQRLHEEETGGWCPCPDCCETGTGTGTDCSYCTATPTQLRAAIAGVDDGISCSECDENLNDTFILDRDTTCDVFSICSWTYDFESAFCTLYDQLRVILSTTGGSQLGIRVEIGESSDQCSGAKFVLFQDNTLTYPYACASMNIAVPGVQPGLVMCVTEDNGATCQVDVP